MTIHLLCLWIKITTVVVEKRHINIKYLGIREHVKDKKVVIEHVSKEVLLVDPLTKALPP